MEEPIPEAVRRAVHDELREAIVQLYEPAGDGAATVVGDVERRCAHVEGLLQLVAADVGAAGEADLARLRRAAHLLAPIRRIHLVLDALDELDEVGATGVDATRAVVLERAAALDALLAPGCAVPEAAAALLADVDANVDTWMLPGDTWMLPPDDAFGRWIRRTSDEARRCRADPDRCWRLVRVLAHQLAIAGLADGGVEELARTLDDERSLRALDEELGPSAPVAVAALSRARRDELRRRAEALTEATLGPA